MELGKEARKVIEEFEANQKKPVDDDHVAYNELPEEKKAKFLRIAETWLPDEPLEKQVGEGRATFIIRCQKERENRELVIGQRAFEAYARTLQTSKANKLGATIVESLKADVDESKARQAIEAKEKAYEAEIRDAREAQRRREDGTGAGYGGITEG